MSKLPENFNDSESASAASLSSNEPETSNKGDQPDFSEAIEVMKRVEIASGNKEGKMRVKGSILIYGEETIHSSFDNTTTVSTSRLLFPVTDVCTNLIRTLDPTDNVELLKINFSTSDRHTEVLAAPDGKFQAIVVQEHEIRSSRLRSSKKNVLFSSSN